VSSLVADLCDYVDCFLGEFKDFREMHLLFRTVVVRVGLSSSPGGVPGAVPVGSVGVSAGMLQEPGLARVLVGQWRLGFWCFSFGVFR
jgi:hypothetical protein